MSLACPVCSALAWVAALVLAAAPELARLPSSCAATLPTAPKLHNFAVRKSLQSMHCLALSASGISVHIQVIHLPWRWQHAQRVDIAAADMFQPGARALIALW